MHKKYLISCGDSFTEGHDMGEQASWAYWTANSLGLGLINIASGGMSNEWINMRTLSYLQQNKYGILFESKNVFKIIIDV